MAELYYCEQCGELLTLTKRIGNTKPHKRAPKGNRVRRYKCSNVACDHVETIFADGIRDKELEPILSKLDIDQMHKQQEINNN